MYQTLALKTIACAVTLLALGTTALAQDSPPLPWGGSDLPFWEPTNGPSGPTVVRLSKGETGTILAATNGGTYRSTNSGVLWERVGPFANAIAHGGGFFFIGSNGQGVSRSTDDGRTWTKIEGLNPFVHDLAATPDGAVFAATEMNEPGVVYKGEVFYLASGGTGWSKVYPPGGFSSDVVVRVAVDSSGHLLFSSQHGAVMHSPDTGKTYSDHYDVDASNDLQVGPDGTVYGAGGGGVFRSTDHGITWTEVNSGLASTSVFALAIRDGGNLIAGTSSGVFGTTDMGSTWTLRSAVVNDVLAVAWLSEAELIAGTLQGISMSTNSGLTWRSANAGIASGYVTALGIDRHGRLYSGQRVGTYRTEDRGDNWTEIPLGAAGWPTCFCFKDTLVGFATFSQGGVYRTTDGGDTWTPSNSGLTNTNARVVGVTWEGNILLGTWGGGLFRSTDDGNSWTSVSTGADTIITAFARLPRGELLLGGQGNVLLSVDGGLTWFSRGAGLPDAQVRGIILRGVGTIFAGLDGGGVFRTTDHGLSWTPCNTGFPVADLHVYSMDANAGGHIFVAGYEGVYRSTDQGESWEALNTGPSVNLTPALIIDAGGYAFVGTGGAGVWRSTASTVVAVSEDVPVVSDVALYRNYPNPFNGTTRISFRLHGSTACKTHLAVFDFLGREIAVLLNEDLGPGLHTSDFKGDGLASGVYFYRLRTGGAVLTRRMLYLR